MRDRISWDMRGMIVPVMIWSMLWAPVSTSLQRAAIWSTTCWKYMSFILWTAASRLTNLSILRPTISLRISDGNHRKGIVRHALGNKGKSLGLIDSHDYAPLKLILKVPSFARSRRTSAGTVPSPIRVRISCDIRGMMLPVMI